MAAAKSLSKNAIGFTLSLMDELSPALAHAEDKYKSFITAITQLNAKASKILQTGMGKMAGFANGFAASLGSGGASAPGTKAKSGTASSTIIKVAMDDTAAQRFWKLGGQMFVKLLSKTKFTFMAASGKKTVLSLANLPKFSHGGIVGPPGEFGLPGDLTGIGSDDQLIAAKTGEMVIPGGQTQRLIGTMVSIEDYLKGGGSKKGGAAKREVLVSLNQILPQAQATLSDIMSQISGGAGGGSATSTMADPAKAKVGVEALDKATTKLTEHSHKLRETWKEMFERLLGPERFLAVNKAIGQVTEGFSKLSQMGLVPGTEKLGNFIHTMNNANAMFGMSREELHKWENEILDIGTTTKGAFDTQEIAHAVVALRQAGITSKQTIKDMAVATAALVKSGAGEGSVASMMEQVRQGTKFTKTEVDKLSASMIAMARSSGRSLEDIVNDAKASTETVLTNFSTASAAEQEHITEQWLNFSTAMQSQAGDTGKHLSAIMEQAFTGDQNALQQLNEMGMSLDQNKLIQMVKDGTLSDAIGSINEKFKGVLQQGNAQSVLNAIAPNAGLKAGDLLRLSNSATAVLQQEKSLVSEEAKIKDGREALIKMSEELNTTMEQWQIKLTFAIKRIPYFGQSIVNASIALKEFGFQNAHSAVYLAKEGIQLMKLIPGVASFGGVLKSATLASVSWLGSLVGISKKAPVATKTIEALEEAGAKATPTNKTLGKSIGDLGAGIGNFIKNVGGGVGGGIEGLLKGIASGLGAFGKTLTELGIGIGTFLTEVGVGLGAFFFEIMTGLATGLALFAAPPVILGTTVVVLALIGLAGALWIVGKAMEAAAPGLAVLEKGFESLVNGIVAIDTDKLLALGPALVAVGAGFSLFGAGVLSGAVLLAAAAIPLAAAAIAMAAFNWTTKGSNAGAMETVVTTIADAFYVNPKVMEKALLGVNNAVHLLSNIDVLGKVISATKDLVHGLGDLGKAMADEAGNVALIGKHIGTIIGAIGNVTNLQIKLATTTPALTPAQINQAVAVTVQGKVDAEDSRTHDLLEQLISVITGGKTPATASLPTGASGQAVAFASGARP